MARALGYELPELDSGERPVDRMVMVQVDSTQETTQEVHQEVTIESIHKLIHSISRDPEVTEELEQILYEFENEAQGNQDTKRLRALLSKADDISGDVASEMAVWALKRGLSAILGL